MDGVAVSMRLQRKDNIDSGQARTDQQDRGLVVDRPQCARRPGVGNEGLGALEFPSVRRRHIRRTGWQIARRQHNLFGLDPATVRQCQGIGRHVFANARDLANDAKHVARFDGGLHLRGHVAAEQPARHVGLGKRARLSDGVGGLKRTGSQPVAEGRRQPDVHALDGDVQGMNRFGRPIGQTWPGIWTRFDQDRFEVRPARQPQGQQTPGKTSPDNRNAALALCCHAGSAAGCLT